MSLKEILLYVLRIILLIFSHHGRGLKYSCGSNHRSQNDAGDFQLDRGREKLFKKEKEEK